MRLSCTIPVAMFEGQHTNLLCFMPHPIKVMLQETSVLQLSQNVLDQRQMEMFIKSFQQLRLRETGSFPQGTSLIDFCFLLHYL